MAYLDIELPITGRQVIRGRGGGGDLELGLVAIWSSVSKPKKKKKKKDPWTRPEPARFKRAGLGPVPVISFALPGSARPVPTPSTVKSGHANHMTIFLRAKLKKIK